jgi:hypothetical protein
MTMPTKKTKNEAAGAIKLLPFHPLANIFPLMEGEEFNALVEDICKNGLREDIDVCDGKIIDGRNRARACVEAGVKPRYRERRFNDDAGIIAFIVSKNIHRRHLNSKRKREIIAELLKANPEKSDLAIAKETKTGHPTVARVRAKMEKSGDVEHRSTRTDTKGRNQPAKKSRKLPPGTVRKPLPDCPLCEGTGRIHVNTYSCAGIQENTEPMAGVCACVQARPRPTLDELQAIREGMLATESKHAPLAQQPATKPASAKNEFERHEELFGRLNDIADELDDDQSQRLRALVNELADKLELLRGFARTTIELSRTTVFMIDDEKLSGANKELLRKWELDRRRVETLATASAYRSRNNNRSSRGGRRTSGGPVNSIRADRG